MFFNGKRVIVSSGPEGDTRKWTCRTNIGSHLWARILIGNWRGRSSRRECVMEWVDGVAMRFVPRHGELDVGNVVRSGNCSPWWISMDT